MAILFYTEEQRRSGRLRWPAVGLVALLFLPGCIESGQGARYPSLDEPVAVLREDLRLDGHAEDLVPIYSAAVSDEGTIAIIQRQDGVIRFFSPLGEPLGSFGGRGEGPGEFVRASYLGWLGDTLWVLDNPLGRISFILPSLELARMQSNLPYAARRGEQQEQTEETLYVRPLAPGPRGSLYGFVDSRGEDPPEPFRGYGTISRLTSRGMIERVILTLPSEDAGPGPFHNIPAYDIAPGVGRAAVAAASLEGPDAGTFSLVAVDLVGDTVFARRYLFQPEEIPGGVADSVLDLYAERRAAAMGRAWNAAGAAPPMYPPFAGRLLIGGDGSVWIRLRRREDRTRYYVVGPGGEPRGTVWLRKGNRVVAATLEHIWMIERGVLDVESVVRYRVNWR